MTRRPSLARAVAQLAVDLTVGTVLGFAMLVELTGLFIRDGDELRVIAGRVRRRFERRVLP